MAARLATGAAVLMAFALALVAGGTVASAKSLIQGAYDQCVQPYNAQFRSLPSDRAMVVGTSGNNFQWRARYFWSWDSDSQGEATSRALANCRKAGFRNCSLFADDAGLTGWARRISNNGGRAGGGGNGAAAAILKSFMQGLLSGAGGGYPSGGTYSGGGGSVPTYSGITGGDDGCHGDGRYSACGMR